MTSARPWDLFGPGALAPRAQVRSCGAEERGGEGGPEPRGPEEEARGRDAEPSALGAEEHHAGVRGLIPGSVSCGFCVYEVATGSAGQLCSIWGLGAATLRAPPPHGGSGVPRGAQMAPNGLP